MSTLTNNNPGKIHQHDESPTGARKRVTSHRPMKRRRSGDVDVSSLAMRVRF